VEFWLRILKERDHSEDQGVKEENVSIKMGFKEMELECVDWIQLAQDRNQ
jgi:hypothetical protein